MKIKSVPKAILILGILLPLITYAIAMGLALGKPDTIVNRMTFFNLIFYTILFGILPFGFASILSIIISRTSQLSVLVCLLLIATPLQLYYLLVQTDPNIPNYQGGIFILVYWLATLFAPALGFSIGHLINRFKS
jgi:hypothetical protein